MSWYFSARYFEDRGRLGQAKIVVHEHRHQPIGVEGDVWLLIVGACENIDRLLIAFDAVLGYQQPNGTARSGYWMHVELHGSTSRFAAGLHAREQLTSRRAIFDTVAG